MENNKIKIEKKIFSNNNIKMAKVSKNQKIRNDTLKLLTELKDKFNTRSYKSFQKQINEKRIDAVGRLADKLKTLQSSTEKNITKKSLAGSVRKVKEQASSRITKAFIKRNTEVLEAPSNNEVYEKLKNYTGDVRIIVIDADGKILIEFNVDLTGKKEDIMNTLMQFLFFGGTDGYSIFLDYPNAKVYITKSTTITPQRVYQAFKHGITNCLFKPIIQFFQEKHDTAESKSTKYNYATRLNKTLLLEKKYYDGGVPENNIQGICDELQIDIEITQPFQKAFLHYRSNKKALKTFRFINTRTTRII